MRPLPGGWGGREKEFRLDSNDFAFICYGVGNMSGHKRNGYKIAGIWASTKNCPLADSFPRPMASVVGERMS